MEYSNIYGAYNILVWFAKKYPELYINDDTKETVLHYAAAQVSVLSRVYIKINEATNLCPANDVLTMNCSGNHGGGAGAAGHGLLPGGRAGLQRQDAATLRSAQRGGRGLPGQ